MHPYPLLVSPDMWQLIAPQTNEFSLPQMHFPSSSLLTGLDPLCLLLALIAATLRAVNNAGTQQADLCSSGLSWLSKTLCAEFPAPAGTGKGAGTPSLSSQAALDKEQESTALLKGWLHCCFTELFAPHPGNLPCSVCLSPWQGLEVRAPAGSWPRAAQPPQGCAWTLKSLTPHTPAPQGPHQPETTETQLLLWITEIKPQTFSSAAISQD